ncbi:hypothetical protein [Maribellus mangrovi]|uniref:hypothetical protein n=1 Tax=Maribellus mangrovi TaxID=3133146 RepID=UPI0030EDF178
MKRLLLQLTIFLAIILAFDYFVVDNIKYLKYLSVIQFGFELNTVAKTVKLEGLVLFINLGTLLLLGGFLTTALSKINHSGLKMIDSFASFYNFFVAIIVFNFVGGVAYYICSLIPWISAINDFLSELLLVRMYINFPLLENFDYSNAYMNFSFTNLLGLLLLFSKHFKKALNQFFQIMQKIEE